MEGNEDTPLYTIGVASRLLNCEQSALRRYEKAGLIRPERSGGNTRLYSENELEHLREVLDLIEGDKVNMAGASIIIDLRNHVADLERQIGALKDEISLLKERLRNT